MIAPREIKIESSQDLENWETALDWETTPVHI
jgi:hypothetical protein